MADPLIGITLGGRYRLVSVLGQGGMGIVYRAADVRLAERPCAIKLLMGTSMDPEEGARFERELAVISRLRSAHVVQVLDTGKLDDGRRYIVMELLEGLPLETLIKQQGAVPVPRAIALFKGVLAALAEAHEHGVVHRDLKPANVFVSRARTGQEMAKVLDFGIAKDMRQKDGELTAASMLIGTPKYMAPEQFLKLGAEPATDLYAAGLLFYQLLCGRPPFLPEDPVPDTLAVMPGEFRVGWLHVNQLPVPLDVEPALWAIISQLLEKDPRARFQEAQAVIDALGALEGMPARMGDPSGPVTFVQAENSSTTGFPVLGESLKGPLNADGGGSSRTGLWVAVAAVLVAGLGAGGYFLAGRGETPSPAAPPSAEKPRHAMGEGDCLDVIQTQPPGAMVLQGENPLGRTPLEVQRPCREVWQVSLFLEGHEDAMLTLRSRAAREEVSVVLKPKVAVAPRTAAPASVAAPTSVAPATEAPRPSRTPRLAPREAPREAPPRPARPAAPVTEAPRPERPAAPVTEASSPLPF